MSAGGRRMPTARLSLAQPVESQRHPLVGTVFPTNAVG